LTELFSIICTVKNRVDRIRASVQSVLAQDDPDVELVVQDGASTDGTLEILREYGDRIRLRSEPDDGPGDGLFRALRRARGELWGSCLSDEQLVPDAASWARRTLGEHPDIAAIYGFAEGVDREGALLSRQDASEFSLDALLTSRQLPPFVASFFRMSAYRQLGLWEYTGAGEFDLWCRLAVRFPIRRFPKLVAYYGMDRTTLSNQAAMFEAERNARLEVLRRLFHDDEAGRRYQHLERRAYAGYFLRYAGMFVRVGDWERARASMREAMTYLGSLDALPDEGERLRAAWLHYTVEQPFNVWTVLPSMGIRRVAIFGGQGWGLAIHRQLAEIGVTCVAVIDNDASMREAAMIPAPYFSQPEFITRGPSVDAVLSSLQGDHDRDVLASVEKALNEQVPVLSWKTLFSPLCRENWQDKSPI
jgi:glycosyltransferase involved in cell wall biosynthesis